MPAPAPLNAIIRKLGRVEKLFIATVVLYIVLLFAIPTSGWTGLLQFIAFCLGIWIAGRLIRLGMRHAIWRLRNRLIVTYLFIGGVPVLLLAALVGLSIYGLASQVATYFVTSELDRRVEALHEAALGLASMEPQHRTEAMQRMGDYLFKDRFPGVVMLVRTPAGLEKYPANTTAEPPSPSTGELSGIVARGSSFYAWSHLRFPGGDVTVMSPMGPDQVSRLVPRLGPAQLLLLHPSEKAGTRRITVEGKDIDLKPQPTDAKVPAPAFRGDAAIAFGALVPFVYYDKLEQAERTVLYGTSRLSTIYDLLFASESDDRQVVRIGLVIIIVAVAFLIVEMVSLVVGITMTRTITSAVHHLYEGTQRVIESDFSHRIAVKGTNQLSTLGHSFNLMTERIEKLLAIAKEKERLQSEIEIAREVQSQLYPKKVPDVQTLRLTAVCKPARMVSGDYFDYECMSESRLALAIGDVAGKGISAALLMATLQSSLRTELRNSAAMAAYSGNGHTPGPVTTASLVLHLNEQLYAYTSPEKYATFYLGIYDEVSGLLRYTNAGHLPPILVRNGEASRLNVDGTVVGAFPFAQYDESQLQLERGDLLVCFTDGVSEPENEYGEMFGEDRLMDLVVRNAHQADSQIVESIIAAVEQWTGTPELQDDLTLLLARRQ